MSKPAKVIQLTKKEKANLKEGRETELIATKGINIAENVAIAGILTSKSYVYSYVSAVWANFLSIIFFPSVIVFNMAEAFFAWREVQIENALDGSVKNKTVAKALVYTATTLALILSAVSMFLVSFGAALVAPLLLCGAYAAKMLYNFGSAIYYAIKSTQASTDSVKLEYLQKATMHLFLGIAGLMVTAGLGLVLLLNKATFGFLGLVGAAIAGVVSAVAAYTKHKDFVFDKSNSKAFGKGEVTIENPLTPVSTPAVSPLPNLSLGSVSAVSEAKLPQPTSSSEPASNGGTQAVGVELGNSSSTALIHQNAGFGSPVSDAHLPQLSSSVPSYNGGSVSSSMGASSSVMLDDSNIDGSKKFGSVSIDIPTRHLPPLKPVSGGQESQLGTSGSSFTRV